MSFLSKALIAGTLCVAFSVQVVQIESAQACTAPYPAVLSRHVLPNGDLDVSLDARVILHVEVQNLRGGMDPIDATTFVERAGIELRTSEGELVETEASAFLTEGTLTIFLEPKEQLAANTEYVVSDKIEVGTGGSMQWSVPFLDEAAEVTRFTTGVRAAGSSPRALGTVTANESGQACDNSGCCGPYDAVAMTLTFEPPGQGLLARIEREEPGGHFAAVAWVRDGQASGWSACMGAWGPSPDFRGSGTYRVRYEGPSPALGEPSEAVTLAGQCGEDEPEGPIGEPNPPVEAPGTEPSSEAGANTDEPDSGCAGGGAGALGWLGLGLLAALRKRQPKHGRS